MKTSTGHRNLSVVNSPLPDGVTFKTENERLAAFASRLSAPVRDGDTIRGDKGEQGDKGEKGETGARGESALSHLREIAITAGATQVAVTGDVIMASIKTFSATATTAVAVSFIRTSKETNSSVIYFTGPVVGADFKLIIFLNVPA
jgi:hypothetical protein